MGNLSIEYMPTIIVGLFKYFIQRRLFLWASVITTIVE